MNLLKDNIRKLYFRFLIPALGSAMVMSIYTMTDAIVIGKGVGADGLSGLNLTTPPISFIFSMGILFGVGAAVHMNVHRGAGNHKRANQIFTLSLAALSVVCVILWILFLLFSENILRFMGANDTLLPYSMGYMHYIVLFFPFAIFSNFLSILVRADGDPNRAMAAVMSGGVLNVILDILFVFPFQWGMGGAALASALGMITQCSINITHFFTAGNTMRLERPSHILHNLGTIAASGISGSVNELANAITVFLFNIQMLRYNGSDALAVYSVIANCAILFNSLFTGVGQAVQPIISTNLGAGEKQRIRQVSRLAYLTAGVMGIVFALLGILFPRQICRVFLTMTPSLDTVADYGLRLYFPAFLMMGLNVLSCYYLQSILKTGASLAVSLCRNLVLSSLFILLLPVLFGGGILWGIMPLVELLTILLSVTLVRRNCGNANSQK